MKKISKISQIDKIEFKQHVSVPQLKKQQQQLVQEDRWKFRRGKNIRYAFGINVWLWQITSHSYATTIWINELYKDFSVYVVMVKICWGSNEEAL